MSLPPFNPERSTSGIAVDPRTQERVVPQTRRADGSVRKEIRIRQGFTPQEDVNRFRGSKQQQMDANALPKGHIIGWGGPSGVNKKVGVTATDDTGKPLSKSQKKNEKRREKKREDKTRVIEESWDDDESESESKDKSGSGEVDKLAEELDKSIKLTGS